MDSTNLHQAPGPPTAASSTSSSKPPGPLDLPLGPLHMTDTLVEVYHTSSDWYKSILRDRLHRESPLVSERGPDPTRREAAEQSSAKSEDASFLGRDGPSSLTCKSDDGPCPLIVTPCHRHGAYIARSQSVSVLTCASNLFVIPFAWMRSLRRWQTRTTLSVSK